MHISHLLTFNLGEQMRKENGVELGTKSVLRHLTASMYSCDVLPFHTAVAIHRKYKSIRLSSVAANVLILEDIIKASDVKEYGLIFVF